MQDRDHVVLPRKPDHISDALLAKLSIAKVMEFTSDTLRSGVVVWADDGPRGSALLFLRGAPAVIRDLVQSSTVPQDFSQVSESAFDNAAPVFIVQQACLFTHSDAAHSVQLFRASINRGTDELNSSHGITDARASETIQGSSSLESKTMCTFWVATCHFETARLLGTALTTRAVCQQSA